MKLFTIPNLLIYYPHGKSARKVTVNAILSMKWQSRKNIHDMLTSSIICKLASIPPISKENGDHYKFQWVFYRDKSTGRIDLSNLSYLIKVYEDAICTKLGIDDSISSVIEHKIIFGGMAEKESLTVHVMKTKDVIPTKVSDKIAKIYELLGIPEDKRNDSALAEILM